MSSIAAQLIHWHVLHGRHNLPWQGTRDPYAIWLSEIMLQQTQVATVIPYYERFMQEFPSVHSLAEAPLDAVLALWSGLGYYSRARNLHLAARKIVHDYQGQFPSTRTEIERLPGIGRSTAAAVAVFAFGRREAILDGNVKRVFARYFGISGFPGETKILHLLWEKAEAVLPADCGLGKIDQAILVFRFGKEQVDSLSNEVIEQYKLVGNDLHQAFFALLQSIFVGIRIAFCHLKIPGLRQ